MFRALPDLADQVVQVQDHLIEGSTQLILVGGHLHVLVQISLRYLIRDRDMGVQGVRHAIECRGELANFIGTVVLQPFVKLPLGNGLGHVDGGQDGAGQTACHQ